MESEEIAQIIRQLHLEPLPFEGGLVAETYRASEWLAAGELPARYGGPRRASTAIYYALTEDPDSFSAFHSLLTDEVFHFYLGDAVEQIMLLPGGECHRQILGSDLLHGQLVQSVVPAGAWQALRLLPGGRFALLGTTMSPGYAQTDFTLGDRATLQAGWLAEAAVISRLTRI